jgi:hypothetical protein
MRQYLLRRAVALVTFSASVLLAENVSLVASLVYVGARCFLISFVPFTLSAFCVYIALHRPPGKVETADGLTSFMLLCFALLLLLAGFLSLLEGLASAL